MQSQNKIFEDLSKVATAAAGTFAGIGREMETAARARMRELVGGADGVSREEFEAVRELAANARAEVEALKAEIAALRAEIKAAKPGRAKPA